MTNPTNVEEFGCWLERARRESLERQRIAALGVVVGAASASLLWAVAWAVLR